MRAVETENSLDDYSPAKVAFVELCCRQFRENMTVFDKRQRKVREFEPSADVLRRAALELGLMATERKGRRSVSEHSAFSLCPEGRERCAVDGVECECERREEEKIRIAYGWCPECGAGNDAAGYAHLPTCAFAQLRSTGS
jgi:hypothetical protein